MVTGAFPTLYTANCSHTDQKVIWKWTLHRLNSLVFHMHGMQKRPSLPKIMTGTQPESKRGQGLADLTIARAKVEWWLASLRVTLIKWTQMKLLRTQFKVLRDLLTETKKKWFSWYQLDTIRGKTLKLNFEQSKHKRHKMFINHDQKKLNLAHWNYKMDNDGLHTDKFVM